MYLIDLDYWAIFGGIIGFVYAWRKLAASSNYAITATQQNEAIDENERRVSVRYLRYRQLGSCLITAFWGAILGSAIWVAAYLIWLIA